MNNSGVYYQKATRRRRRGGAHAFEDGAQVVEESDELGILLHA